MDNVLNLAQKKSLFDCKYYILEISTEYTCLSLYCFYRQIMDNAFFVNVF